MKRIGIFLITFLLLISSALTSNALDKDFIDESLGLEKKLLSFNYEVGKTIEPIYIVIHETAGYEAGIDAEQIYKYWNRDPDAKTSTHFIVDENKTLQLLELNWKGWHVGDNDGHSDITNSNSIGIEICVNEDGDYVAARARTIRLVKYLMRELNIDADHVVRHYDASGKFCPEIMMRHPELWDDFKSQISMPDVIFDYFYPQVITYEEEVDVGRYKASNNLVESKLILKKYNVSSFLWSLLKAYPFNMENVETANINKRTISHLGYTDYLSQFSGMSAPELTVVLQSMAN